VSLSGLLAAGIPLLSRCRILATSRGDRVGPKVGSKDPAVFDIRVYL